MAEWSVDTCGGRLLKSHSDIVRYMRSLPDEKRRSLERFIRDRSGSSDKGTSRGESVKRYAASFAQRGLWIAHHMSLRDNAYNMIWRITVPQAPDTGTIQEAIDHIVERHDVLRTCYTMENDGIWSMIAERPPLVEVHGTGSPGNDFPGAQDAERALVDELHGPPFNLKEDVPLRLAVLPGSGEELHVYIVVHHIAFDAWSAGVLARELGCLYHGNGDLPALELRYSDFAEWQREYIKGSDGLRSLEFWRRSLGEALSPVTVPPDRPRAPAPRGLGGRIPLVIDEDSTRGLTAVARETDTTQFVVCLAAFKALLYRYTGQEDITVGTLVANRPKRGFELLIGCFANTIALRSNLSGNLSVRELIGNVKQTVNDALAHKHVPFPHIVRELPLRSEPGKLPAIQVMFVFQNIPGLKPSDVVSSVERLHNGASFFDITLTLNGPGQTGARHGWVEYDTDLYEKETIHGLVSDYLAILGSFVRRLDTPVDQLPDPGDS